jgi:hypothetical protein
MLIKYVFGQKIKSNVKNIKKPPKLAAYINISLFNSLEIFNRKTNCVSYGICYFMLVFKPQYFHKT